MNTNATAEKHTMPFATNWSLFSVSYCGIWSQSVEIYAVNDLSHSQITAGEGILTSNVLGPA